MGMYVEWTEQNARFNFFFIHNFSQGQYIFPPSMFWKAFELN